MPTSISGMRRSRRAAGIAALACGALLVVPAAQARNVQVDVSLENSNGYGMSIGASRSSGSAASFVVYGAERELTAEASAPLQDLAEKAAADVPGSAKLERAANRHRKGSLSVQVSGRNAISSYGVTGAVTRRMLFGRVYEFGRVFLRFHPHKERTLHGGCFRIPMRVGTFTGKVRFMGEDGYVDVNTDEARGRVLLLPKHFSCKARQRAGHTRHRANQVTRERHRYTALSAISDDAFFGAAKESSECSLFYAGVFEDQGPVFIDRYAFSSGKPSQFRFNKRLTSARLAPKEQPFQGAADFNAPHRWTGSLSASFPGAPDAPLAGRGFRAQLERYGARSSSQSSGGSG